MASTEILLLIAGLVAIVCFWFRHSYSYWRRMGVPCLEPWPLLGNLQSLFAGKHSLGLVFSAIYEEPSMAEAPAVGIYILNTPALVLRDIDLIKSVLIKDFQKFSNRYSSADPHGDVLGSNNLFFVKNPQWSEIRMKLTPVFTSGKIKQMYPLMLEIAADLETHLDKRSKGISFDAEVKEICASFTTDLIASIAFGLHSKSLDDPNSEFRAQGRKLLEFTLPRAFEFFIAFFLPQFVSLLRIKLFTPEFSNFMRKSIDYVMTEREKSGKLRNDLIDVLVSLKKEAAAHADDAVPHIAKDTDFLVAQAAIFLTAGFETSSSTMAFALYELAMRPDLQKRLRTEIVDALVAGNGTISYEKINELEYLHMVLSEVLRMYPVMPFLDRQYSRSAGEPPYTLKQFNNYALPDGMPVYISVHALQRDPKYWPNPNTFDPERFSSEKKKSHHPMTYLPFGTGPHNCIGSRIGLLQAKIGLVHMLKNHNFYPCAKTLPEMKFDPKSFVLQCKGGIHLTVHKDRYYDTALD